MMRSRFDRQLDELNTRLIAMGAQIERAIAQAMQALRSQDGELARRVMARDGDIDRSEKDIEALCLKLLLEQHPVASDLRLISSALKMITDMERIGDQAADIAEISLYLAGQPYIKELVHIPQMAEATARMVTESIDAFVKGDLQLARDVIAYDDVVDDLFREIKGDLISLIGEDKANGSQAIDLIMIAKYLERIGDHAVNIAGWVAFSITGGHAGGQGMDDVTETIGREQI